ncbi:MAG: alpha/beta hydrolase [Caldilineaceae bacterium]
MNFTDFLQLNLQFAAAAQTVTMRRMLAGPQRPGWSWGFESIVHFLRSHAPRGNRITAAQVRRLMEQIVLPPLGNDVAIRPAVGLPAKAEWVTAGPVEDAQLALFLHGGGYVAGSLYSYRGLTTTLARACGVRLLALDYRLAPEYPFPAALDDACAVYRWLLAHNMDPSQIVFIGDSAGGGLAIAALTRLRDAGLPLPRAAVCLSPWLDLNLSCASIRANSGVDYLNPELVAACARMYLSGVDPKTPLASPLYAELRDLPPVLIQVGSAELFCDEAREFAQRAQAVNVDVTLNVWDDMIHDWHMLYWLEPQARAAVAQIGAYVKNALNLAITNLNSQPATRNPPPATTRQLESRIP